MTPRPPALVTAAASSGPAATFLLVVCQHVRRGTCKEDGVLDAEEFGERCRDCGHVERRYEDSGVWSRQTEREKARAR